MGVLKLSAILVVFVLGLSTLAVGVDLSNSDTAATAHKLVTAKPVTTSFNSAVPDTTAQSSGVDSGLSSGGPTYSDSSTPRGGVVGCGSSCLISYVSTSLSSKNIVLGQSVTEKATVFGKATSKVPTGTVDFQVKGPSGSWLTFAHGIKLVNGKATSPSYMPIVAGDFYFRAIYSGDSKYYGSQSGSCDASLHVNKAPTTETTSLGVENIKLGQSVKDNVTVMGPRGVPTYPTGTVKFQVSFNNGPWTTYSWNVPLVKGKAVSSFYTPVNPGNYYFRAVYSGDKNFQGSTSGDHCEPLHVGIASTRTVTDLGTSTITLGQSVSDKATVTGPSWIHIFPTGTVKFLVSYNGGPYTVYCTNKLSGGTATSCPYTPMAAGNYQFQAVYSGDRIFSCSSSAPGSEPLCVKPAASATATSLGVSSMTLGRSVSDNATVTGLGGSFPIPTGKADFQYRLNGGSWTTFDPGVVLSGGQARSVLFKPTVAGNYEFRAVYSGDKNYQGSASPDGSEPLTIPQAESTTTTDLGVRSIVLGQTVSDQVTVTGQQGYSAPTGNVQFQVQFGSGSWNVYDTQSLTPSGLNGIATSNAYTPTMAGSYHFRAVYLGSVNYKGSQSGDGDEPLTVERAASSTSTLLDSDNILLGDLVYDTATVTGLGGSFPAVTGTVTFEVSFNGGAYAAFDSDVPLSGGMATSGAYHPAVVGNYDFRAIYSGDGNYTGSQSQDGSEPLSVGLAPTFTETVLGTTSITLGQSVTDNATVIALNGVLPVPTGSVNFEFSFNGGAYEIFDQDVPLVNGEAKSAFFRPLAAGDYQFRAVYGGDKDFATSTSPDGLEPLTVAKGHVAVTTELSDKSIVLGYSVTDKATVSSGFLPVPTGTVNFQVLIGNGLWTTYDTKTLTPSGVDGVATSSPYTPLTVDAYHFRAVYAGDLNYTSGQSDDLAEPLTVNQAATTTDTVLSSDTILLGDSVVDTATVNGLGTVFPFPTGIVDFQVSFNNGPWTTYDPAETLIDGSVVSIPFFPSAAGTYHFRAAYGGDANYQASTSGDGLEPLTVGQAPSFALTVLGTTTVVLGGSVTDNVTVISDGLLPTPTGIVDFQVSYNGGPFTTYDGNVPLVNGVAQSGQYFPHVTGNYAFQAVYSGDANFAGSTSINDEPLTVTRAASVTTTDLGTADILLGQSVFDGVTVNGLTGYPIPNGTVDFQVKINGGGWTTFDPAVTLTDGQAISAEYTPTTVGSYLFRAVYSGDGNYTGSQSADGAEPLTVGLAPSGILTYLGTAEITLGQSVTDNVTVFNLNGALPTPTGTVDFQVSFNGGQFMTYDANVALSGGVALSKAYLPIAAGHYEFQAVYSGDGSFAGTTSISGSEPLTVNPSASVTATQLSDRTISFGDLVYDTATVTGLGAPFSVPNGTIAFEVSFNSGAWTAYDTETLSAGSVTSSGYTPGAVGDYRFRALYGGDSNYTASQSGDGAEPLTVGPAQTFADTFLGVTDIILGQSVRDNVTIVALAGTSPDPSGNVVFQVSFEGGPFAPYSTVALVGGTATSALYQPLAAGAYEFRAVYAGDPNYVGTSSILGTEPLNVAKSTTLTTTDLGVGSGLLGDSVFDTATVTGLGAPFSVPNGTIDFQVQINGGSWNSFDSGEVLIGGSVTSAEYFPANVGTYHFRAVYSGDNNYTGSQSGDNDEPLSVGLAPTFTETVLVTTSIVLGQSVFDNATVIALNGALGIPSGTVTFQVSYNGGPYVEYDKNVPLSGGVAQSAKYTPLANGSYDFQAVYSGDSVFAVSNSPEGSEPLMVGTAATTTVTQLTDATILFGDHVFDTATVTGLGIPFPTLTGTVTFEVSINGGGWSAFDKQDVSTGTVTSIEYMPAAVGTYHFRAIYSGDNNYTGSQSGDNDELLTVTAAPSFVLTVLGVTDITLGQSVFDNATVINLEGTLPIPTGSVSFQVNYSGQGYVEYSNVNLVNGEAKSAKYTPLAAGDYQFQAVYAGDGNFLGSSSIDGLEPLTVAKAASVTTTALDSVSIRLGDVVYDTVTVAGLGSTFPVPTGSVNFEVRLNGGSWTSYDTGELSSGSATSIAYEPSAIGLYEFRALYAGDGNYTSSMSKDTDEPLPVEKAIATAMTDLGTTSIRLGQSVTDNVTVFANVGTLPMPTGTVDFQVSIDGGAFATYDSVALVNGIAQSAIYTPREAGSYQFQAVYGGDGNFEISTSINDEPLTVEQAGTVTTTILSDKSILLGSTIYDTATVTGLGLPFPVPTGTVNFEFRVNGGSWSVFDSGTLIDGQVTTSEFPPQAVGEYEFRALYTGDKNYTGSQSGDTDEPLTVDYAPSWTTTYLGADQITGDQMVTDNATVTALNGLLPVPTGNVTFEVSVNGGAFVAFDKEVPLINGMATSTWYDPPEDGNYLFRATYNGDMRFSVSVSPDDGEPLTVG
jgi:hypothetical protein